MTNPAPLNPEPSRVDATGAGAARSFEAMLRGEPQKRVLTLARAAAVEDGRVEMSFSNDQPILRTTWWGERYWEVLSHEPGSIDLSRAEKGLPYLVNHDRDQLRGRAEDVRIEGGKIRAKVRYSDSPEAQQLKRDVVGEIMPDTSIWYDVTSFTEGLRDGLPLITITKWTPTEVSSVSVPADVSVGLGRGSAPTPAPASPVAASPAIPTPEAETTPTTAPTAAQRSAPMSEQTTPTTAPTAGADNNQRNAAVLDLLELARANNVPLERAEGWVKNGKTVDQARTELFDELKGKRTAVTQPASEALVDLSERDQKAYSISRAIEAVGNKQDCFELEVSRAISKKLGRNHSTAHSFFVPTTGAKIAQGARANPPMDTATANHGKEFVFTERGEFIDLLRARTKIIGLGATMLSGLRGNVGFPKQKTANTANWTAENGSANALTDAQTDLLTLTPKQLIAASSLTRTLLAQGTPAVDAMIMADLAKIHAIAIDAAAINGAGTTAPLGILGTTGIGSVAGGTNGLAPAWAHLTQLETAVAAANGDIGSMALLTTPGIRGKLKATQQFASSSAIDAWTAFLNQGYKAEVSTNVPSTLTKGSSSGVCHAIIFGVFSELIIGEWGAFELITDPFTLATTGVVRMITNQLVDVGVRHPAAFAAMQDALIT